jgi:hypothetical protein
MMKPMASLCCLSLLAACGGGDKAVNVNNSTPEATITSHNDGDVVFTDVAVEFRATVTDDNDAATDLEAQWTVGSRVACPFIAPDASGASSCVATLQEGEDTVQVEVRDPKNATGTDIVQLDVQHSDAPVAAIIEPLGSGSYYSDHLISFEGQMGDTEDGPEELSARWESSIDGELGLETAPDSSGIFTDFGYLSEGEHGITLRVEDSSGKTASESVTVTVKGSNTAPACAITAPATGSAGSQGELVIFEATVSDADIDASMLSVLWSSDKDGELGGSTPNSSGGVSFPYSDLTVDTHVVSVTVTDEVEGQCVADVIYTVGSAPQIALTAPSDGDSFDEGESITFTAEITDNEDAPSTLAVEWSSSLDGVFSTAGPSSIGTAQFSTDALSPGEHSITVTATDPSGLYSDALFAISVNGLPTAPAVSIAPDPATSADDLTATASGSTDPEGQTVTYSYEWILNAGSTGNTGAVLPASATSKNDMWTVRATPMDGTSTGPYAEASLTIANSPPEVTGVAITPGAPSTQDDLVCSYTVSDADGDSVSIGFVWLLNGNIQSSTSDTLTGPFQQGDEATCQVSPNDGDVAGATGEDTVTITNSSPAIASVILSPSMVYTGDYLYAEVSASDGDGDALTYTWDWYVDDGTGPVLAESNAGSGTTDSLDGVYHFSRDDLVHVVVGADDGSSITSLQSGSIAISNSPPSATNILITPGAPAAGLDDLVCLATGSDADGDAVSLYFAWEADGAATSHTTDTVPASDIADGEIWTCIATPNDGDTDGPPGSAQVEVGADNEEATGSSFCASAGEQSDASGYSAISCLSDQGLAGDEASDPSAYVWQPGSHYVYTPE